MVGERLDLVAGHLGEILAEDGLERHDWRRPLCHPCRHCLEPMLAFLRGVVHVHNLEAGTRQKRLHGIGCGQMADGWLARPRHRKQHLTPFALQDVVDPEAATAFEHPSRLLIDLVFGRDVHRYVNGHRRIEVRVGERQGGCVSLLEGYAIAQTDPAVQRGCSVAKRLRQIDAGNPTSIGFGKCSCRPSKPAANVEDVGVGGQVQRLGELQRGLSTADMKLVDRTKIRRRQLADVFAGPAQTLCNRVSQIAAAGVVARYLVDYA